VLVLSFVVMLSILLGVLSSVFEKIFHDLSQQYMNRSSRRVSTSLYSQAHDQYSKMYDFGDYDSTFNMLNPDGVSSDAWEQYFIYEFNEDVLTRGPYNFVGLYWYNGTMANSTGLDLETNEVLTMPEELRELTPGSPFLLNATGEVPVVSGYLRVSVRPNVPLLVTAMPVIATDVYNGTAGILLFATYMSAPVMQRLADSSQLCLTLYSLSEYNEIANEGQLPTFSSHLEGTLIDVDHNNISPPFTIRRFSSGSKLDKDSSRLCFRAGSASNRRIASFHVFQDVFRQNGLVIRADTVAYVDEYFTIAYWITFAVVLAVSVPIPLIILLFTEFSILRPIRAIMKDLNRIISERAFGDRVRLVTSGQIGTVAMQVNAILQSLNHSQDQVAILKKRSKRMEKRVRLEGDILDTISNSIPDMIVMIDRFDLTILKANDTFYKKLGYLKAELVNSKLFSSIICPSNTFHDKESLMIQLEIVSESAEIDRFETELTTSESEGTMAAQIRVKSEEVFIEGNISSVYILFIKDISERKALEEQILDTEYCIMLRSESSRNKFVEWCGSAPTYEECARLLQNCDNLQTLEEDYRSKGDMAQAFKMYRQPTEQESRSKKTLNSYGSVLTDSYL